jgi:antitoxin ParD1/3/4
VPTDDLVRCSEPPEVGSGDQAPRNTVPRADLAKFCQDLYAPRMGTMNISLPDSLRSFVDEQVSERGYSTSSEYVRELIRKDQERIRLRALLLAGAASPPTSPVDEVYIERLRSGVRKHVKSRAQP